jgi:hypothetical protein
MRAVSAASYVGELECIQELIKAGGSASAVDSNGRNALHHACRKDHDGVVRYLVTTAKVDINCRSENQDTPLHKAGLTILASVEWLSKLTCTCGWCSSRQEHQGHGGTTEAWSGPEPPERGSFAS